MKKIIFVSFIRLTPKVLHDWYIDYMIAQGVIVEYWDIVALVREEYNEVGELDTDYLSVFRTFSAVEEKLQLCENRDAFYVMLINYAGRFARIFRLLSKYNCRMIFIASGTMPVKSVSIWGKVFRRLSNPLGLVDILLDKAKAIAYRRLKLVKPFHIIFAAGQVEMTNNQYAEKVIPINYIDYNDYINAKAKGDRVVKRHYAVFLDINLPFQSDLKICNMPAVNSGSYYRSLNRFFDLLELEYDVKTVISAHPKSDYSMETFQGREIYRGRTAEIVKDAEFVISHTSLSFGYAVLNFKPLIFIYTDEMKFLYSSNLIRQLNDFASFLDAALYNVDEITHGRQIIMKDVNLENYEKYKYSFLTTPVAECSTTQEIIWREMSKL